MGGRSWTELFFLDEATAFAAGHRPCFFCRRDDANRFRAAWEKGNSLCNLHAGEIDAVLHRERLERKRKRLHALEVPLTRLPDGAMVGVGEESFLIVQGQALMWSVAGYREAKWATERMMSEEANEPARLLTPPSTVRAFSAGYLPVLHASVRELVVR